MQQDRAGGGEHMKQNQDNRRVLKPPQGEIPQQPQQPQKCPRCDSMNTKFCYYNNYSLSQPRYFCKTCRRYWTQGGTLRNVPVGGGCRKGKRPKTSNSASSASSVDQVIKPNFQTPQTSFSLTSSGQGSGTAASISHVVPTGMGAYVNSDHAKGFLTSLATIHSINNQPPAESYTPNQPLNLGGDLGSNSTNMGLLHGFNAISSFGSSQSRQLSGYFPFEENLVRPSNRAASANDPSQQQDWHQGFPSNANNSSIESDTTMWRISTTTTAVGNTSNNTGVGPSSSLNPDHQWPDLPGYGNPP